MCQQDRFDHGFSHEHELHDVLFSLCDGVFMTQDFIFFKIPDVMTSDQSEMFVKRIGNFVYVQSFLPVFFEKTRLFKFEILVTRFVKKQFG
jgi:hypothetical protein